VNYDGVLSTLEKIIHQNFVDFRENKQTHRSMCVLAANWLIRNHKCSSVLIERGSGSGEMPDVIGFYLEDSFLIEVKESRTDFLKDKKKVFRFNPKLGMGKFRYYACPENIITPEDLPDKWGLLYVGKKGRIRKITPALEFKAFNRNKEFVFLTSALAAPWKLFSHWSDAHIQRIARINWMSDSTKFDVHAFCARVAVNKLIEKEEDDASS